MFFILYIRQKLKFFAICLLFFIIFISCFALYHLPVKAVLYPTLICFVIYLIFMLFDFYKAKRKHELLESIKHSTDITLNILPKYNSIDDNDYKKIIDLIIKEYNDYKTLNNKKFYDIIDYYTIWVHQIKTPISSMRLQIQNEDSEFSRRLSLDLFRIEQYVEMVLTFLKLDLKNSDYLIKEYDLDKIIKSVVKKFSGEFINRKLKLNYNSLNKKIITDEKWFSFVIEQLLSNALKYTPSGSITISLQSENMLCISDTGIGISPEDIPRIFENGYTGYNGRTDKKASGIGLYLCKRILKNLGHEITVKSVLDKGTSIYINLEQAKLEIE